MLWQVQLVRFNQQYYCCRIGSLIQVLASIQTFHCPRTSVVLHCRQGDHHFLRYLGFHRMQFEPFSYLHTIVYLLKRSAVSDSPNDLPYSISFSQVGPVDSASLSLTPYCCKYLQTDSQWWPTDHIQEVSDWALHCSSLRLSVPSQYCWVA